MNKIGGQFASIEQITGQYFSAESVNKPKTDSDISFDEILEQKKTELDGTDSSVKFSKHASMRLQSRNINLTEAQNARLEQGMEQASKKRDSGFPDSDRFPCIYRKCPEPDSGNGNGSDRDDSKCIYEYRRSGDHVEPDLMEVSIPD
jgi:hypothetical protein